ncbi:TlpA family protein disulfide reductase [Actinomycetota bacterium]
MSDRSPTPKRKKPARKPVPAAATGKAAQRVAEAPKPKRDIPVVGIVFTLVALALVAAVLLTGNSGGGEAGEPTVEGEWLPFYERTDGDSAIGLAAPTITGADFDGNEVVLEPNGTPTAVVFLAHWCPHCQVEVPKVQSWLDAGGGVDGVEIISIATSINSARENYPPSEWLEREDWETPVIRDDTGNTLHSAFGGGGFPFWVFLNGDGTVAVRTTGELDLATLEQVMLTLE